MPSIDRVVDTPRIPRLRSGHAFGTKAVAESVHEAGVTVRREPVAGSELAQLIATRCDAEASALTATTNVRQRSQRFEDAILIKLTDQYSAIACVMCSRSSCN